MFRKNIKAAFISLMMLSLSSGLFADAYFSGRAGGKINMKSKPAAENFDPSLTFQAFFSGQLNFSKNLWSHVEFSFDTSDLIDKTLFNKTDTKFQLDEFSLIFRQNVQSLNNYFSVYMGTYDPIGSDLFLQRQFGITPITSKITESWMGMAGSLLYPHFGVGISDVIRFSQPVSTGIYAYINHEDKDYYVFNGDFRIAANHRFLTYDIAAGIGAPIATKAHEDTLLAIEKIYWHAGTTLLLGNNHTSGFFLQAGIFNGTFSPLESGLCFNAEDIYLLAEPRFNGKANKLHISFYNLPEATVKELLFVYDTLGVNVNFYHDALSSVNNTVNFGVQASLSFPGKDMFSIATIPAEVLKMNFNVHATPYITANLFKGEINAMVSANIMSLIRGPWYKFIDINVGYKTAF